MVLSPLWPAFMDVAMRTAFMIAIFAMLAGATCANAGVMMNCVEVSPARYEAVSVGLFTEAVSRLFDDDNELFPKVREADSAGLGGLTSSSPHSISIHAFLSTGGFSLVASDVSWGDGLANSRLPIAPILGGLLKPA
jgi:hypothetical protein